MTDIQNFQIITIAEFFNLKCDPKIRKLRQKQISNTTYEYKPKVHILKALPWYLFDLNVTPKKRFSANLSPIETPTLSTNFN